VAAIDKATGVDQMGITDPGMQQLARLDKAVNWYLQRGDRDKAEAVAMSLLQYGARKTQQAGQMAAAALSEYQETGDPADLQAATGYIKLAHQLIPDGFNIDIAVDPKTREMVVTAIDADGKAQKHVVDPAALPGLLQKAIDGSAYWSSMFRIGHPAIAAQRENDIRSAESKFADRQYDEEKWQRHHEIERGEELEDKERSAQEEQFRHDRGLTEGQTAAERARIESDAFYDDWGQRYDAAQGPEKTQLAAEGLGYTYEHAKDRERPVADEEITGRAEELQDTFGEDLGAVTGMARMIASKNGELDGVGAMNVASALVTEPELEVRPDGTLGIQGLNIVFNPSLLPQLKQLRDKYRQ
jgi:hypothetical protein